MFLNQWRGCPELLCQRHRGCMEPNIFCCNVERLPLRKPRASRKVQADVHDAINPEIVRRGLAEE